MFQFCKHPNSIIYHTGWLFTNISLLLILLCTLIKTEQLLSEEGMLLVSSAPSVGRMTCLTTKHRNSVTSEHRNCVTSERRNCVTSEYRNSVNTFIFKRYRSVHLIAVS